MSTGERAWVAQGGDDRALRRLAAWLAERSHEDGGERRVADDDRRDVARVRDAEEAGAPELLIKSIPIPAHRRSALDTETLRRGALGQGPAQREYRRSRQLAELGAPVLGALAWARDADGEEYLVRAYHPGRPLRAALQEGGPAERRERLTALGRAVAALHATGWVHGDLHLDNVIESDTDRSLWIVDPGRAARRAGRGARHADLARLEVSLRLAGLPRSARMRVRRAALRAGGTEPPRSELRAVGERATSFARAHARRRTRRAWIPRRRYAEAASGELRGMRMADFSNEELDATLAAHRSLVDACLERPPEERERLSGVLKFDHRSRITRVRCGDDPVVVKEVVKGGAARRVADGVRGSPAARSWIAGHGLRTRGFATATPRAFLERRRIGVPIYSLVVLEDLSDHPTVAAPPRGHPMRADPERAATALCDWLVRLHRCHIHHGDLQGTHVYWNAALSPALIDLESLRFARRLDDARRIRALAQLNSSIPNEVIPNALRRRVFDRYQRALPFDEGPKRALARIVETSRSRGNRWSPED